MFIKDKTKVACGMSDQGPSWSLTLP